MNSSEIEQLTDELIGVAVLSLLKDNSPISTQALIARLRSMESSEPDSQRRKMLGRIIAEISNNTLGEMRHGADAVGMEWNEDRRDNIYPLFGNKQPDSSKKH
ncbi:hypothetical protein [Kosakonia sp. R1.Fl]|uniref:hypothetical protein n=1 Tax=Kosakonia sp. R1.Fl TaxID=2928706 RepID=UPI00201DC7BB|nr:hypothetical protein [Kosakonia sp. R1.Fl]MCL6745390.1 hypothetical protein [Kosakonia sp. R1.Fl]